jgi:hypothetical protein
VEYPSAHHTTKGIVTPRDSNPFALIRGRTRALPSVLAKHSGPPWYRRDRLRTTVSGRPNQFPVESPASISDDVS